MSNAIPALVAFSTLRLWILLSSLRAEHGFLHGIVKIVNWHRGSMGKLWCQSGDGHGGGNQPSYFSLSVLIAMVEAIRL